jgi:hypothetical protein
MRILLEENLPVDGFSYSAVEAMCGELFEWNQNAWIVRARRGESG